MKIALACQYKLVRNFPAYRVGTDGSLWTRIKLGGPVPTVGKTWKRMRHNGIARYYATNLSNPVTGAKVRESVHILILRAFRGLAPAGTEGRHLNGNSHDNRLDNLEWASHLVNMRDQRKHGTLPIGEKNTSAKLTENKVHEIRRLLTLGMSQRGVAKLFGVSKYPIWAIDNNKNWVHV